MTVRRTYLAAGLLCLALALAGVALPLLPATPFALLSGWFLGRSSPRVHRWLMDHPILGPTILDWNTRGAIRPAAKVAATLMVGSSILWIWIAGPAWMPWIATFVLGGIIVFVLTRPN